MNLASRKRLKSFLKTIALYSPAVNCRDAILSFRFLRRNATFWWKGSPDGLPIPPLKLIGLVAGPRDIGWFLEGGRLSAESIVHILKKNGLDITNRLRILDFGCGVGRTIRNFKFLSQKTAIYGVDYNPQLVNWCSRNLNFAEFHKNDVVPPLSFPDGHFDLVYALSVFTHMNVDLQHEWITELERILCPGGALILTTHGERYCKDLTSEEVKRFNSGMIVVREHGEVGSNSYGAYHPPQYVLNILCRRFRFIDHEPEGAKGNPYQDIFLFQKP